MGKQRRESSIHHVALCCMFQNQPVDVCSLPVMVLLKPHDAVQGVRIVFDLLRPGMASGCVVGMCGHGQQSSEGPHPEFRALGGGGGPPAPTAPTRGSS